MLSLTHGLVGATIAAQPLSPLISLPLGFLSHYLLDLVPHWDWGVNFKKRSVVSSFLYSLLDGLTAILLIFLLFQAGRPLRPVVWLGMFSGMGQDFLDAPMTFLRLSSFPPLARLHRLFHANEKNMVWGLLPQIILLLACLIIAL